MNDSSDLAKIGNFNSRNGTGAATTTVTCDGVQDRPPAFSPGPVTTPTQDSVLPKKGLKRRALSDIFKGRTKKHQAPSYWQSLEPAQQAGCKSNFAASDRFGDQWTAWPVAGCLREKWDNHVLPMTNTIRDENQKWIYEGQKWRPFCSLELWMMKPQGYPIIQPTLVAKCEVLVIAKKTLYVLKKNPSFLDLNLGFDFLPWKDPLPALQSLACSVITINPSNLSPTKTTLGGCIVVGEQYYGLTVAHPFQGAFLDSSTSTKREESPTSDSESGMLDDDSQWDEDFRLFQEQHSLSHGAEGKSDFATGSHALVKKRPSAMGQVNVDQSETKDLEGVAVHFSTSSYDPRPGRIGQLGPASFERDWALITINDPSLVYFNEFTSTAGQPIAPTKPTRHPPSDGVFICTPSGLKPSKGLGMKCGLSLGRSGKTQELWLIDGSSEPGTSGSWVLEDSHFADLGDLSGVIIASSERSKITYIMPAIVIFRDIELAFASRGLGSKVWLPTFENFHPDQVEREPYYWRAARSSAPQVVLHFPGSSQKPSTPEYSEDDIQQERRWTQEMGKHDFGGHALSIPDLDKSLERLQPPVSNFSIEEHTEIRTSLPGAASEEAKRSDLSLDKGRKTPSPPWSDDKQSLVDVSDSQTSEKEVQHNTTSVAKTLAHQYRKV